MRPNGFLLSGTKMHPSISRSELPQS
jgi:hypothetical protein